MAAGIKLKGRKKLKVGKEKRENSIKTGVKRLFLDY